jgi:archaellum component FlaF (FlaF/FlaG flagellin family)
MLALVILVVIVDNVFLANYQMDQVDMSKNQEKLIIRNIIEYPNGTLEVNMTNSGSVSVHIIRIWVISATSTAQPEPYEVNNVYLNSGQSGQATIYLPEDITVLTGGYTVKAVTERGNIAVYSTN